MKTKLNLYIQLFLPVLLSLFIQPGIVHAQYDATISDSNQQTVKGWGCCPLWIGNHDVSTQPLSQEATYNMGATIIRHSQLSDVGDGDGNINPTGADLLCRAIQITKKAGLPYTLSSWTPPLDMKTIPVFGSVSNGVKVHLKVDKEQAFCNLVVNLFNYMSKTKDLPLPIAYSFQNEPTCETEWGGCIYDAAQYKRVAKLLRTTLDAAGYSNIILLGPEDGGYYNGQGWNWSLGLLGGAGFPALKDAEFNKAIGAFASHSYDWSPNTSIANYNAWVSGCDTWGKDRWQTEYCPIDQIDIPQAISTTRRFISDMAFIKNNYWFTWTVNDPYGHDVKDALCLGNGITSLSKKPAYYVLKKLFTNIPIGSKVRRMTSTDNELVTANASNMDMVAFASDTNMVVVIVNPTSNTRKTKINGLFGASADVYQMATAKFNTDMKKISSSAITANSISDVDLQPNSVTIIITTNKITYTDESFNNPNSIEIYPNPAADFLAIKNCSDNIVKSATILNSSGQTLIHSKSSNSINVSTLNQGVYFVKLETNSGDQVFKFLKR